MNKRQFVLVFYRLATDFFFRQLIDFFLLPLWAKQKIIKRERNWLIYGCDNDNTNESELICIRLASSMLYWELHIDHLIRLISFIHSRAVCGVHGKL